VSYGPRRLVIPQELANLFRALASSMSEGDRVFFATLRGIKSPWIERVFKTTPINGGERYDETKGKRRNG